MASERPATRAEKDAFDGRRSWKPHPIDWETAFEKGRPPPRDWVIDHWLGIGHVTLLSGAGGLGKSMIAQQISTAASLGKDFIGQVRQPRNALAWMGEDDEREITERQFAICERFNVGVDAMRGKLFIESMTETDCTLVDTIHGSLMRTNMVENLRDQVGDYQAELVVLDNISCIFGGNENDRHHVKTLFSALAYATAPTKASVLLLGHIAKNRESEFSGSTAWENSARARLWFSDRPPDQKPDQVDDDGPADDLRYLSKRKVNYTARDLCIMQYSKGAYDVIGKPSGEAGLMSSLRHATCRRVVTSAFDRLIALNLQPSDASGAHDNYLPSLILKYKFAEGHTRAELADAMRALMVDGVLKRSQVGVYSNRNPKYGLTKQ